jgi:fucose permease
VLTGTPPVDEPWRWWRPPPPLLLLGTLVGLAYLIEGAWQNWSAILLERTLDARPAVAALGPAVFALTAAGGRFAGQPLIRRVRESRLLAVAGVVAAGGTLIAAAAPTIPVAIIGIGLAGAGTSVCAPTLLGRAARAVPEHRHGAAIGTVTTLGYLGFGVAPAIVGLLSRATSLRWAMASVGFAAVLIALGGHRSSRIQDDELKGTR